jgi:hypothetical protein
MNWLEARIAEGRSFVERLLAADEHTFAAGLRAALPERSGLYAITEKTAAPGDVLRAGRAKGGGGLRQRIYMNHFMDDQAGNLRSQLVRGGICRSLEPV